LADTSISQLKNPQQCQKMYQIFFYPNSSILSSVWVKFRTSRDERLLSFTRVYKYLCKRK